MYSTYDLAADAIEYIPGVPASEYTPMNRCILQTTPIMGAMALGNKFEHASNYAEERDPDTPAELIAGMYDEMLTRYLEIPEMFHGTPAEWTTEDAYGLVECMAGRHGLGFRAEQVAIDIVYSGEASFSSPEIDRYDHVDLIAETGETAQVKADTEKPTPSDYRDTEADTLVWVKHDGEGRFTGTVEALEL